LDEVLQAHLGALSEEVRATSIPGDRRDAAGWCIRQLPPLYAKFLQTNESRYGEEITRLFQGLFNELTRSATACPKAQKLAADLPGRLQLLHGQLGLPRLILKVPRASVPRSRKARTTR